MEAQTLVVAWTAQIQLWMLPLSLVFGKAADLYGRRKIFYVTTAFTVALFLTFTIDAYVHLDDWVVALTAPLMSAYYVHDIVPIAAGEPVIKCRYSSERSQ